MTDFSGRRQGSSLVEEIDPPSGWTEDSSCHYLLVKLPGFSKEWLDLQVHDSGHIVVGGERQTENKIFRFEQMFKIPENSDTENISGKYEDGILYVIVPKLVKEKERKPLNIATDEHIRGKKHEHEHEHEHDQEEHDKKHKHRRDEKHEHEHDQEERYERHKHHQEKQDEKHKHRHDQERLDKRHKHHQEEQYEKHELDKEEHYGGGRISHHREEVPTAAWTREGGILGSAMEILSRNKGIAATAVLAFSLGVLLSQKFQSNAGSGGGLPPM